MKGIAYLLTVPYDQTSRLQRREQQLMRVERNRIGPAAGRGTILHSIAEDEQRAVCADHVQPQALSPTHIAYLVDRIDRPAVHGAGRRNYAERSRPRPAVFRDSPLQ